MKEYKLMLFGLLCLAFGWFAHYTVVPETKLITVTDTLIVTDTLTFVELGRDWEAAEVIVISGIDGWRNLNDAEKDSLCVVVYRLPSGGTKSSYNFKNNPWVERIIAHNEPMNEQ